MANNKSTETQQTKMTNGDVDGCLVLFIILMIIIFVGIARSCDHYQQEQKKEKPLTGFFIYRLVF